MKLKNKKTGETAELIEYGTPVEDGRVIFRFKNQIGLFKKTYRSLAEFNEDWEDYEEPVKPYWFINDLNGEPLKSDLKYCRKSDFIEWGKYRKQIGNYFETKEEAENAVEKLKALAKLKQYGFRFIDWELDMETVADGKIWFDIGLNTEWDAERLLKIKPEAKKSLDTLFGGEE